MTGAIIVVTVAYYILDFIAERGLRQAGVYLPFVTLLIPPLTAGLLGGMQYARTEQRGMRLMNRLSCAFNSCLAIIFAPLIISLILILAQTIVGGFVYVPMLPGIASFLTATGLIQMAMFALYGLPAIFISLTVGQWLQYKLMTR